MGLINIITGNKSALRMIKPSAFVHRASEKTKLNWFCYEMSMTFYEELVSKLERSLKRYRIYEKDIARFSIYLIKKMKPIMLDKLSGKIDNVYFSYEMVESYFPRLNDRMVNKMLDVISKAWMKQLDFCVVCPTRCVSEKDVYCTMFDDEDF